MIYNRPIFLTERRLLNAIRNRGLQFINRLADITTIEVYGYRKEDDRRHGLKSQAVSAYVSGRPELSPKINPDAVGALFGSAPTLVTELVNYADTVVADLGHIRRDFPKESLEFATIRARREMRRLHPELSIDAINQLGRFFSYQSR